MLPAGTALGTARPLGSHRVKHSNDTRSARPHAGRFDEHRRCRAKLWPVRDGRLLLASGGSIPEHLRGLGGDAYTERAQPSPLPERPSVTPEAPQGCGGGLPRARTGTRGPLPLRGNQRVLQGQRSIWASSSASRSQSRRPIHQRSVLALKLGGSLPTQSGRPTDRAQGGQLGRNRSCATASSTPSMPQAAPFPAHMQPPRRSPEARHRCSPRALPDHDRPLHRAGRKVKPATEGLKQASSATAWPSPPKATRR